ncbi:hypothetical protein NEAUS03_0324 [Nematocida ausubeli]|nr:hypothetical protein NEAUS03_0324 [Nematocida ausubeli]
MSNRKNTNKNEYYMKKTRSGKTSRKQELDAPKGHEEIFKKSLVRMFLVFIILAIQNICAIVEADAVEDIMRTVLFRKNGISWTVKLRGALCPIMLYVCDKNNHIYNIRFNSSEIDAYYTMSDKKNNNQYTRDPSKDTVHKKDINGDVLRAWDRDYYTAVISMFPSPKQKISIFPEEDCKDSFTLFLKSKHVKKHAHMILASLLLLSEGIKVPLFFDKTSGPSQRLVLRKVGQEKRKGGEKKEEEHFSLEMVIAMPQIEEDNSCDRQKLDTYQKKAVEVIEFFIHYANDYCKMKYLWPTMMPTAASGPFQFYERVEWLDRLIKTPYWLIQTYIHFFLETAEEANSFNRTVYLMLDEHIIESRRNNLLLEEEKERRLFNDLFSNDHNELKEMLRYWKKIQELENLVEPLEKIQLLPFTKHSELPIKKIVNLDIWEGMQLKTEVALNEIEAALLGIFSCLTYDPNSNSYETDHIPNLHIGIKSFFSMPVDCISYVLNRECGINVRPDNNKPIKKDSFNIAVGKKITQEIYCQWKEIVRDIMKDSKIRRYENDQNITVGGIIDLISIVLALAGKSKKEVKSMMEISTFNIASISGENNRNPFRRFISLLEEKISIALASLSRNCIARKNLNEWYKNDSSFEEGREVFTLFTMRNVYECNDIFDFYGDLKIYYAYKRQAQPMIIDLSSKKIATLELGSPIIKLDKSIEKKAKSLKRKIIQMQRLAFPYFILSDYAVHIELYTLCDYIIINSGYINLVNRTPYSTLNLIYPKVQPFQYEIEYTTDKLNIIISKIWNHRFAPVHTHYNLRYINNILANQQAPSMEIRKYLIICIGCRVNNIKENLSRVRDVRNETWEIHRLVCIKDMAEIIKNLLLVGSDLDVANAIATCTQILWHIGGRNTTELLERLSRKGRNKAIECLKKYCDISDKTTA